MPTPHLAAERLAFRSAFLRFALVLAAAVGWLAQPVVTFAAATGAPGMPNLTQDKWDGSSSYSIIMDMWWGNNGTSWQLFENGVLVKTTPLTDGSPNAQHATVAFANKANGSYTYTTKLINSFGTTAGNTLTYTVTQGGSTPTVPPVPTGLAAAANSTSQITVTWSTSSGATSYDLQVDGATIANVSSPYTHTGLTAGSSHTYAVRAKNSAGSSAFSAAVTAFTQSTATIPAVPSGLAATANSTTQITVTWNASSGATGYDLQVDGPAVANVSSPYAHTGLAAGSTHTYAVRAKNSAGASAFSTTISAKTSTSTGGGAPVTITYSRLTSYSGGYGGQIDITNQTAQSITNWTLVFTTPDGISLYNGTLTRSGNVNTVNPPSWSPTLAAGATWTSGFAGTAPGTDWNPPLTATFNGATITVNIVDKAASGGGGVVTFSDFETAAKPLNQITLPQGTTQAKLTWASNTVGPLTVATNNPQLLDLSLANNGTTLVITTKKTDGGRAGIRITDTGTGNVRYLGFRIKNAAGAAPVFPSYVSVGVCSEDLDGDLKMFQNFGAGDLNRRADNRYVYLNGGPVNGWYTWTSNPGDRARTYIRNSLKYGLIPTFVWYNIPDGGESYSTDLSHIQDATYMQGYFDLLMKTIQIFNTEAPNETVMLVMEPDFIGYMMQNSGKQPNQITAQVTGPAKAAGITRTGDPTFTNTLDGLVKAIGYYLHRDCPQVQLGWQINVWSSPDVVPGGSLMKTTDVQGWAAGRAFIQTEAQKVAAYYIAAGITSSANFISFDKYGFDAAGADGNPANPAAGNWFWNSDHWNNYLLYVSTLHTQTGLPVALWQLPVGRINTSLAADPYTSNGQFAPLANTVSHYEDSSATFFFGDRFTPGSSTRLTYFSANQAADSALAVSGSTLTWGSHFLAAKNAGVFNLMFGDGVGASTRARPASDPEPTDGWWLMTALQRYLVNPVPLK